MGAVLILEPLPAMIEDAIRQRRALGQDRCDEVWKGVYHMAPAPSGPHAYLLHRMGVLLDPNATRAGLVGATGFNLGSGPDDYRVPDSGYLPEIPTGVWTATAVVVVEILSPGDETYAKFDFCAACGVQEIIVVDPAKWSVEIWEHTDGAFVGSAASAVLEVAAADIADRIEWPAPLV